MSIQSKLKLVVAVAALGFAAGAHAEPVTNSTNDPNAVSEEVSFWDLDQHSAAGAKRVLLRIRNAAEDLCGPEPAHLAIELGAEYRHCMAKSVDRAVAALNNPLVTALNGGGGRSANVLAERGQ